MAKTFSKKVAFWGTPPPPIGGMTVHIERLSQRLAREDIPFEMYNFSGKPHPTEKTILVSSLPKWYLGLLFGGSAEVHYVISTRTQVRFLAVLFARLRRKKVILRVGGKSLKDALSGSFMQRWMSRFALRYSSAFIGVNEQICSLANQYRKNKDARHIPGFIPPVDTGTLPPDEIQSFWKNGSPKIVVSGQILEKGEFDIYGMWDTLEAVDRLKNDYPKLRLVIFSYQVVNEDNQAVNAFKKEIEQRGLNNNIFIFESKTILWPSIKHCDIFLRPSHTDGDANSLREALALDTVAIASDAVVRPEGSILYPTGDIEKMVEVIRKEIDQPSSASSFTPQDNATTIIDLIRSL